MKKIAFVLAVVILAACSAPPQTIERQVVVVVTATPKQAAPQSTMNEDDYIDDTIDMGNEMGAILGELGNVTSPSSAIATCENYLPRVYFWLSWAQTHNPPSIFKEYHRLVTSSLSYTAKALESCADGDFDAAAQYLETSNGYLDDATSILKNMYDTTY